MSSLSMRSTIVRKSGSQGDSFISGSSGLNDLANVLQRHAIRSRNLSPRAIRGIAPCSVELCEASVTVNDVKRPWQFGQERDCLFPFRSERQARAAMPEVACKL